MRINNRIKNNNRSVLINVFNSGYLIALLLFLAGSVGSLCDGVIASRGIGVAELAAIGIAYPYTKTMECISLLFSSGSQIVIGRKIGQNRFDEVSGIFYSSLAFVAILSVLIAVIVSIFADSISVLFGASSSGGTLIPTADYLVSLAVGAPAHLITLYLIPIFQLDEKRKLIDMTTVIMTVVNVSLNILFVLNHMGIRGIGLSTSISYYVALLLLSSHFFEKKKGILMQGRFGVSMKYMIEIVREGAPSAFKNVTSIIFNTSVNNLIKAVGTTEAMAAFSVYKMTKFIFLSVSEAIINPVRMIQSMLLEEKDRKTLREIFRYSIMKGLGFSALLSSVLLIFGRSLYSVIVSGAVLDETLVLMRWAVVIFMMNTFVCYYLAYFQAIKRNVASYSISVVLNIFTIPHFFLLAKAFGVRGVWMSFALQFVIVAVYVVGCAYIMGRKNKSLIDKLLVLPVDETEDYHTYDFHIGSFDDARSAISKFSDICNQSISQRQKAFYCSLAMEETVFNILEYQKAHDDPDPNIDVHIIVYSNDRMVMRIKESIRERNPFVKYEFSRTGDDLENLGIKMVKSFAEDVKYSFIYGVNFITITV